MPAARPLSTDWSMSVSPMVCVRSRSRLELEFEVGQLGLALEVDRGPLDVVLEVELEMESECFCSGCCCFGCCCCFACGCCCFCWGILTLPRITRPQMLRRVAAAADKARGEWKGLEARGAGSGSGIGSAREREKYLISCSRINSAALEWSVWSRAWQSVCSVHSSSFHSTLFAAGANDRKQNKNRKGKTRGESSFNFPRQFRSTFEFQLKVQCGNGGRKRRRRAAVGRAAGMAAGESVRRRLYTLSVFTQPAEASLSSSKALLSLCLVFVGVNVDVLSWLFWCLLCNKHKMFSTLLCYPLLERRYDRFGRQRHLAVGGKWDGYQGFHHLRSSRWPLPALSLSPITR